MAAPEFANGVTANERHGAFRFGTQQHQCTLHAGLATGGTGDILTGLIAGLLAQGLDASSAATLGVFVHGLAGDLAAEALSQRGMIAGDVAAYLPSAWRTIEGAAS